MEFISYQLVQDFFPTASVSGVITLVITGKGPLCSLVLWADVRCYKWSFTQPASVQATRVSPRFRNHKVCWHHLETNQWNKCLPLKITSKFLHVYHLSSSWEFKPMLGSGQAPFQADCFPRKDLFVWCGWARTAGQAVYPLLWGWQCIYVCMYVWMNVCKKSTQVCRYACICACDSVFAYIDINKYICIQIYIHPP